MTSRIILPSKTTGETVAAVFPFLSQLAVGATILTAIVTSTTNSGTDLSPSSMISGSASIVGSNVSQLLTGGVEGVLYYLVCTITTSDGQTLVMEAFMAVVSSGI